MDLCSFACLFRRDTATSNNGALVGNDLSHSHEAKIDGVVARCRARIDRPTPLPRPTLITCSESMPIRASDGAEMM